MDLQKTSRSSGIIGSNPIVISWARRNIPKADSILDFGSGPLGRHVRSLRKEGYKIDGCQLPGPKGSGLRLKTSRPHVDPAKQQRSHSFELR